MSVKNNVLQILELNKGNNISGQELADKLCVSRTAVWKAIKSLKEEGYIINATPNKGYSLSIASDVISSEGIHSFLEKQYTNIPITVYKSLVSTNTQAKIEAMNNAINGTVIVAEEQTNGRGRFGRNFFSPPESGIYMSIILKPKLNIADSVLITTAASVAVCNAINKFTKQEPKIKWVNDIYINNKKVCGILTEAVTDFESGTIESVILGIGINVKTKEKEFPLELQNIAGSILHEDENFLTRNQIAAEVINQVFSICENLENREFLNIYKERSMILGENILYNKNNQWLKGFALDIDKYGGLIILNKNGEKETLHSGEISIKKSQNR